MVFYLSIGIILIFKKFLYFLVMQEFLIYQVIAKVRRYL